MPVQPALVTILTVALSLFWTIGPASAESDQTVEEFRVTAVKVFEIDGSGNIRPRPGTMPVAEFGAGPWTVQKSDPRMLVLINSNQGPVWVRMNDVKLGGDILPQCIEGVTSRSADTVIAASSGVSERGQSCIRKR